MKSVSPISIAVGVMLTVWFLNDGQPVIAAITAFVTGVGFGFDIASRWVLHILRKAEAELLGRTR